MTIDEKKQIIATTACSGCKRVVHLNEDGLNESPCTTCEIMKAIITLLRAVNGQTVEKT